jgi:CCR4-NOT transcription complex subunit 6
VASHQKRMNTKDYMYTWHLSLRVDRPVEGCTMHPHAYMYGKKLDERDYDKTLPLHSKKMREPPPQHEFSYRWFRGPLHEACAYEGCPRRTSFSPHDWSRHAVGGPDCALQCVSAQSSLYRCVFCNAGCLSSAWKTQYTVPREARENPGGGGGGGTHTPSRSRSASVGSDLDAFDDAQSTRSCGSTGSYANPGTPKGYNSGIHNAYVNSLSPFAGAGGGGGGGSGGSDDEWIEISRDQVYIPGPDDVGRKLKVEASAYSLDTREMLMARVVKTDVVLARAPDPAKRNLVTAKGAAGIGPRFRVASYNVLAEIYATQQQYPYCDFWALSWDYRFQNILREILDAVPEVLCLQEIQADYYENHVYGALSDAGYEGVYKQKTRQSMGLAGKVDGCAIFWRRTKFHLIESYSIEFNELAQRQASQLGLNPRSDDYAAFLNRLSKDNVAQLIVLEFMHPPGRGGREINQVCIANTHLYSNKDFPDVKLWQTWQLLMELESFVVGRGSNLPLVICGDFNSTPDTAVYDLLARQAVHPGHPDVNVMTGDDTPNVLPDAMNITHSFQLGSAYQTVLGEEPWTTNYTLNFKGVLDYIWYSAPQIVPLSVALIPDETQITKHGEALPSTEYSSDHIMLISDLQIISNGAR